MTDRRHVGSPLSTPPISGDRPPASTPAPTPPPRDRRRQLGLQTNATKSSSHIVIPARASDRIAQCAPPRKTASQSSNVNVPSARTSPPIPVHSAATFRPSRGPPVGGPATPNANPRNSNYRPTLTRTLSSDRFVDVHKLNNALAKQPSMLKQSSPQLSCPVITLPPLPSDQKKPKDKSITRIIPFKKKKSDADIFVAVNPNTQRKRSSDTGSAVTITDAPPQGGPTRAYNKKSDFFNDGNINRRLSKNLAAPAMSLHHKLDVRPSYESLRSSQILQEALTPSPYVPPAWTSRTFIAEEWQVADDIEEGCQRLICRSCTKHGFHIEAPRRLTSKDEADDTLFDGDRDVKFFQQLIDSSVKIVHFYGDEEGTTPNSSLRESGSGGGSDKKDKVIVSMEEDKTKKFRRVIVRTVQNDQRLLLTTSKGSNILKLLCNQCPRLATVKLTKVKKEDTEAWTKELLRIENSLCVKNYKFGVFYARDNQTSENEFYNNTEGSPAFDHFLSLLGDKIEMEGWTRFKGGLSAFTGSHSIYTEHHGFEIMFHVTTMLNHTPNDQQQVERKRHLGNDVVLIIFKEGTTPLDPKLFNSHFNHVFVVVQPQMRGDEVHYAVEWCAKPDVPPFHPYSPIPNVHPHNEQFRKNFLTKLINAERAAMYAKEFKVNSTRTRRTLFQSLADSAKKK